VAQNVFAVELIDKVQKYEPRANVVEVSFTPDNNGRITAEVVITSG
jgi:predicted component of type VI protein secretion system